LLKPAWVDTAVIPIEEVRRDFFPHLTRESFLRKQAAGGAPPTPSGSLPEVAGDPLWRLSHFVGTAREPGALREPGGTPPTLATIPLWIVLIKFANATNPLPSVRACNSRDRGEFRASSRAAAERSEILWGQRPFGPAIKLDQETQRQIP
jgi:hypothetical protein